MKGFTNRFTRRNTKAVAAPLPPQPRAMEDIQKECSELLGKAANASYKAYLYSKELAQLNERLEQVNIEGHNRQQLDKEAAAATPEVKNEQA